MPLQSNVNQMPPMAEPGSFASTEASQLKNLVPSARAAAAVKCGSFVFKAEAPEGVDAGVQEQFVASSGIEIAGFVYRVQDVYLPCDTGATLVIPAGQPVPVAVAGAFYAKCETSIAAGTAVYADAATGKVYADPSDNSDSDSDEDEPTLVPTGFVAQTSALAGELVIISK